MLKSYNQAKAYKKSFPENYEATEFRKITPTVVGSLVYGILINTKGKFGASYSLACSDGSTCYWLNIPSWLGKAIMDDFNESGLECTKYFANTKIKAVTPIKTKNGDTFDIEFE